MTNLIDYVAAQFGVEKDEMFSLTRVQNICNARQVCMYFMRVYGGIPFTRVGMYFGKDHATAIHACNTVERHYEMEKKFREKVDNTLDAYVSGRLILPDTNWNSPDEEVMPEETLIELQ